MLDKIIRDLYMVSKVLMFVPATFWDRGCMSGLTKRSLGLIRAIVIVTTMKD